MIDLKQIGVDPEKDAEMLGDLQGNILNGHGRSNARHLFLRFRSPEDAATWVQETLSQRITTMSKQLEERAAFNENGTPGGLFTGFLLSAEGYRFLGFNENELPDDKSFRNGMKNADLTDPTVTSWEDWSQVDTHAVVVLADDNQDTLSEATAALRIQVREFADVIHVQEGQGLKNAAEQHIEHFGYVDGTSQPLFLADKIRAETKAHGPNGWHSQAPLGLALVTDKLGDPNKSAGSYCVYRKLHQDVPGFHAKEQELGGRLGIAPEEAGALAVGRFRDGTPITNLSVFAPQGNKQPDNNFIYNKGDKDGLKCPFQSHIRKTNPRFDSVTGEGIGIEQLPDNVSITREQELSHRIVRRGIPFGAQGNPDVGLIFICFQSDIGRQFEFMQKTWANSQRFVRRDTGVDPVIGQSDTAAPQKWGLWDRQSNAGNIDFDFSGFVTMKGGEYFFAPSMTFLTTINDQLKAKVSAGPNGP